jgi:hypothetical protein
MIPFQIDPKKSQFKNKWFKSSKAPHLDEQSNDSRRKHPRRNKLFFVGNLSERSLNTKMETFNGTNLFQIKS